MYYQAMPEQDGARRGAAGGPSGVRRRRPSARGEDSRRVRGALAGDSRDLEWIVTRFSPLVAAQISFRLGAVGSRRVDVDDVLAEVWLVTLSRLGDLRPRNGRFTPVLLAFLASTALNTVNRHLQRLARQARRSGNAKPGLSEQPGTDDILGLTVADATSVISRASRNETMLAVQQAIAALPELDRQVIVLRVVEGLTNVAAGAELGVAPNTIAQRYRRALSRLRVGLPASVFDDIGRS